MASIHPTSHPRQSTKKGVRKKQETKRKAHNNNNDDDDECSSCEIQAETSTRTGFTQSDLTGSSSSTSAGHARTDYAYSNQSEYVVFSEYQHRKRASSLNSRILKSSGDFEHTKKGSVSSESAAATVDTSSISAEKSVLKVTDCSSSPAFYEPSI
jgi:hypothetical protein